MKKPRKSPRKRKPRSDARNFLSEYVDFVGNNKRIHEPFDLSTPRYISGPVSIAIIKYSNLIWILFGDSHGFGNELLRNDKSNVAIEVLIYNLHNDGFRVLLEALPIPETHIGSVAVLCQKEYVYIDARDQENIIKYTDQMDDMVSQLDTFNSSKDVSLLNSIKLKSWSPERLSRMLADGIQKRGIKYNSSQHKVLNSWIDKENKRRLIEYTQHYDKMMESNADDEHYPAIIDNYVNHLFKSWGILTEAYAAFSLLDDQYIANSIVFTGNDHADVIKRFALEELGGELLLSIDNYENDTDPKRFIDLGSYRLSDAFNSH